MLQAVAVEELVAENKRVSVVVQAVVRLRQNVERIENIMREARFWIANPPYHTRIRLPFSPKYYFAVFTSSVGQVGSNRQKKFPLVIAFRN